MSDLSREQALGIYRMMLVIRRFEERVAVCFADGEIPGFIHLGIGQEAVPAAICALLTKEDMVAGTHRGHGQFLAKGADPRITMAELFGKANGCCRGKGGSMHLCDVSLGIIGTNGIVGASLPIAVGAALAARVRQSSQVAVCFFGDGAANTGAAHEAMNLASLWNLPLIFVCENNLYAEFTPTHLHTKTPSIAERAAGYRMRAESVDGNDVCALVAKARPAIDFARRGGGPTLIEAWTYRWCGHHEGDNTVYRVKGELEYWHTKDPIPRFKNWLVSRHFITADEDDQLNQSVQHEIDAAITFAREGPWPTPESTLADVYA